jgi:hypothetical protein
MPDCEIGKLGDASKVAGDSDIATKKSRMAELVLSPIQRNRILPQENIWSSTRVLPSITRLTQKLERSPSDFTVTFTENKNGFSTVARLA